jgi:hypothetical protein
VRFILKHASERFISEKRDFLGLAEFVGSIQSGGESYADQTRVRWTARRCMRCRRGNAITRPPWRSANHPKSSGGSGRLTTAIKRLTAVRYQLVVDSHWLTVD